MLKTFRGLVTPPYLISRRGEAADGISRVWGYAWSLTTEVLFPVGEGGGAVCVCGKKILAYFAVTPKLRSCHKNWWGVKCIGAHTVTKAAQPIQQGARLVLLGREDCKSVCLWAALFTYYTLYSSLKGSAALISPCLCVWLIKLKKECNAKCGLAASPVCCGIIVSVRAIHVETPRNTLNYILHPSTDIFNRLMRLLLQNDSKVICSVQ